MNDKIKRFTLYNIFFLCAFCCLFMVLGLRSFADTSNYYTSGNVNDVWQFNNSWTSTNLDNERYAFFSDANNNPTLYCSINPGSISVRQIKTGIGNNSSAGVTSEDLTVNFNYISDYGVYRQVYNSSLFWGYKDFTSNANVFSNFSDMITYLTTGIEPEIPFDDTLELDSFKVTTWGIGNLQVLFKSRFEVTWSDSRISTVQVIIKSTGGSISFEGSSSPFKQKFEPELYVLKKGDVVHLTATPYMADGTYGTSLYYSFVFDDNVPGSNIYRKFTNTPYSDNTLTIPYTGVSGQPQSVTAPVDGITTQNVYKVNYNPQTYEYGDINLYEVYYSPVIVYPSDTPTDEIDETQDVINNTYTTNNYYETTKNININFDVSFGDISGSDIQHGFDDFGNFSNGFGGFISKLSSWVLALFPFLSPIVASAIVIMFGLIALLAIIALVLKIASVIADLIPF